MSGNIAVEPLMHAQEAEEMGWRGCCGGTAPALPKEGGKIVSLAEDGALSSIIRLGKNVKMQEATSKFKIRVGDSPMWVGMRNQVCNDVAGPWQSPQEGGVGRGPFPWAELRGGEPNSSGSRS